MVIKFVKRLSQFLTARAGRKLDLSETLPLSCSPQTPPRPHADCHSRTPQPSFEKPFAASCRLGTTAETRQSNPLGTRMDPTKQQTTRCCTRSSLTRAARRDLARRHSPWDPLTQQLIRCSRWQYLPHSSGCCYLWRAARHCSSSGRRGPAASIAGWQPIRRGGYG